MGNGPLILCSFSLQIWSCLTQVLRAVLAATLPSGCAITRYLYWKQKKCIMHWKIWHQNWLPLTCSTFQIYLYEFENFQGRRMDLFGESRNLCEKGFERIGSIRVECGPWVITPANQICAAAMYVEYLEVKYLPVCLSVCLAGWVMSSRTWPVRCSCWRRESIPVGTPGPTATDVTASCRSGPSGW